MAGRQQTAPPQQRRSKDATAHPHQPGAHPDPSHPALRGASQLQTVPREWAMWHRFSTNGQVCGPCVWSIDANPQGANLIPVGESPRPYFGLFLLLVDPVDIVSNCKCMHSGICLEHTDKCTASSRLLLVG
jgi:hypothetical protein